MTARSQSKLRRGNAVSGRGRDSVGRDAKGIEALRFGAGKSKVTLVSLFLVPSCPRYIEGGVSRRYIIGRRRSWPKAMSQ